MQQERSVDTEMLTVLNLSIISPLPTLQRAKEIQDVLLLRRAERVEIVDYPVGLRATFRGVEAIVISIRDFAITVGMRFDGLQYIGGASVMQEKQTLARSEERRVGKEGRDGW